MMENQRLFIWTVAVSLLLSSAALIATADEGDKADANKAATPKVTGSIRGKIKSPYARLARGVVYIKEVKDVKFEILENNPVMDQKNKIFTPHVLPVLVGSTVNFPNTDDVRHNVYSRESSTNKFNLGQYDAGVVKHVKFDKLGITHLGCNVHAEMSAYILVLQNPYFAITEKNGEFSIADVPAGKWELTFFHERIKEVKLDVTVEAEKESTVEFTKLKRKR